MNRTELRETIDRLELLSDVQQAIADMGDVEGEDRYALSIAHNPIHGEEQRVSFVNGLPSWYLQIALSAIERELKTKLKSSAEQLEAL